MRVWLVTVGEPSPVHGDGNRLLRTGILAKELSKRGHRVTWWASSFDHFRKRSLAGKTTEADWEGGSIVFLHASPVYRSNVSLRRILHNRSIAREFRRRTGPKKSPDLILISFPTIELARAAVQFAEERGVPSVVDVRDLWPDVFLGVVPKPVRFLGKAALIPFAKQARRALSRATSLVAVSDGYLEWGLRLAGRNRSRQDRVVPIGYPNPIGTAAPEKPEDSQWLHELGIDRSKFIAWFVGSFGKSYDLDTVIRAAQALERSGKRGIQFVISGDGDAKSRIERMARDLPSVRFTGWIDVDRIHLLRRISKVGLMAYAQGAMQSLPNKFFEYIAAGLPMLSSLEGEAAELIRRDSLGLSYTAGDSESLMQRFVQLYDHPDLRDEMSANCRRVYLERYDAEIVYRQFADYLESFGGIEPVQEVSSRLRRENP